MVGWLDGVGSLNCVGKYLRYLSFPWVEDSSKRIIQSCACLWKGRKSTSIINNVVAFHRKVLMNFIFEYTYLAIWLFGYFAILLRCCPMSLEHL